MPFAAFAGGTVGSPVKEGWVVQRQRGAPARRRGDRR